MRRSTIAALEDEVATLRHLVQAQAEQFEADQLERDAAYEVRLRALERRTAASSTVFDIRPRMNFDRGHDQ
jgi:hypothetical protein